MDVKEADRSSEGMALYDQLVNNLTDTNLDVMSLIEKMAQADDTGQFLCSSARFLAAIDRDQYAPFINTLVDKAIGKDRERRYIGSLLKALWGDDFLQHADQLREKDDNFRRIYKRVYKTSNPFTSDTSTESHTQNG